MNADDRYMQMGKIVVEAIEECIKGTVETGKPTPRVFMSMRYDLPKPTMFYVKINIDQAPSGMPHEFIQRQLDTSRADWNPEGVEVARVGVLVDKPDRIES